MQSECKDLSVLFKGETIRQYIAQQISNSSLQIIAITQRRATLSFEYTSPKITTPLRFIFTLSKSFPVSAPRLHLSASFTSPCIGDCRNLAEEVLMRKWTHKDQLINIIKLIDPFLQKIYKNSHNQLKLQKFGRFHLGESYQLKTLSLLKGGEQSFVFEYKQDQIILFIVSITQTHFLLYHPSLQPYFQEQKLIVPKPEQINEMTLVFAAELQCLLEIAISREIKGQVTLTFAMLSIGNLQYVKKQWVKEIRVANCNKFLSRLLKLVRKYQHVRMELTVGHYEAESQDSHRNISEEYQLLMEATENQRQLRHHFNKDTVQQLHKSYQKLVEFYSSCGLPYQQIYLQKITNLYSREDVQLILGT